MLCMILRITLDVNRKSVMLRAVSLPELSYLSELLITRCVVGVERNVECSTSFADSHNPVSKPIGISISRIQLKLSAFCAILAI